MSDDPRQVLIDALRERWSERLTRRPPLIASEPENVTDCLLAALAGAGFRVIKADEMWEQVSVRIPAPEHATVVRRRIVGDTWATCPDEIAERSEVIAKAEHGVIERRRIIADSWRPVGEADTDAD